MLQRIREGISGPIAWGILALLALVFAVWGINMDFTPQTFAVKVNGDEIPAEPIRRAIQNQVAQYQQALDDDLSDELQAAIRDQVVEQAVLERLLAQRTEEQGYRVGDAELSRAISEMPVFQVGGQFSMDSYQARIRAAGYSTEAFEEEQRRRFEIQQLQDVARRGAVAEVLLSELPGLVPDLRWQTGGAGAARVFGRPAVDERGCCAVGQWFDACRLHRGEQGRLGEAPGRARLLAHRLRVDHLDRRLLFEARRQGLLLPGVRFGALRGVGGPSRRPGRWRRP